MIDWNPDSGNECRDERCKISAVHARHIIQSRAHHRPLPEPQRREDQPLDIWQRADPGGLRECVERAVPDAPTTILEILRDVRDDYGTVAERSIYRHVKNLVAMGRILKLDVGLSFAAYVKPSSRLAKDPARVRDFLLGSIDGGTRPWVGGSAKPAPKSSMRRPPQSPVEGKEFSGRRGQFEWARTLASET